MLHATIRPIVVRHSTSCSVSYLLQLEWSYACEAEKEKKKLKKCGPLGSHLPMRATQILACRERLGGDVGRYLVRGNLFRVYWSYLLVLPRSLLQVQQRYTFQRKVVLQPRLDEMLTLAALAHSFPLYRIWNFYITPLAPSLPTWCTIM